MGPISPPRGTIDTASRTLLHTGTLSVCSVATFTLGSKGRSASSHIEEHYRTGPGVIEYCCVVYAHLIHCVVYAHLIHKDQAQGIESLQKMAMRIIFGEKNKYKEV